MSTHGEKDHREKKARDSSKNKRDDSKDRRPIITQEKPLKSKPAGTSSKERGKALTEKSQKRTEERRPTKQDVVPVKAKRHESVETKIKKEKTIEETPTRRSESKEVRERRSVKKVEEKSRRILQKGETMKMMEERKGSSRRDRTRTRTLSPTEVKQLVPSILAYETRLASGDINREREISSRKKEETEVESGGEDEDYEDDFEDYESDFEEDDELPEEPPEPPSKPAQTTFPSEVTGNWESTARKKQIEDVKRSIERENKELAGRKNSIAKPNEDDSDKENRLARSGGHLIDFSRASKKQKKAKESAEARRRGEQLLSMISLDAISYNILEIPPIPYEDFMKTFGRSNTKQVYTQTNEDNLDEEIQTDDIVLSNKWTQCPPEYLGSRKTGNQVSYILTKEERLGVGGDVSVEEEILVQPKTNGLWNFLSWASQMVLIALEKRSGNFLSLENMPNHSKVMAFGDGFVNLSVNEVPFLKGRSITHLCLLPSNVGRLLSVHANREKSFQKSIICVWSLRELSKPLKILISSNRVTSCCFGPNQGILVFAGLSDGSISLWDLREPSVFHNRVPSSPEWSLQSPTYTTAGNLGDVGHSSPVVSIRLLSKTEESEFGDFAPMQICSLDKEGTVIIWSVIQLEKTQRSAPSEDLGLAHWGRVKLVKSSSFSVFASLRDEIPGLYITCNDILINEAEDDGFYVANSLGSVHHCSSYGSLMKPKYYVPAKQDAIIETTCLELCPFNGNYFLVGCGDGTIRLHSRHQENPLICLNSNVTGGEKEAAVVSLTWMRMRPCVFFALDSLSRINIWDLGVSDMYPEVSLLLTEKKITCMRLLPTADPRQIPFIVVGTEGGSIEIHRLKKQYGSRTEGDLQNEMKIFLKYVSIL